MTKAHQKEAMHRGADEMARSGKFEDWHAIEYALSQEGFSKARIWLDQGFLRAELNGLCQQARAVNRDDPL
jgi:hypothetical protein